MNMLGLIPLSTIDLYVSKWSSKSSTNSELAGSLFLQSQFFNSVLHGAQSLSPVLRTKV